MTAPAVAGGEAPGSEQGGDCSPGAKPTSRAVRAVIEQDVRAELETGISRGSALIAQPPHA